MKRRSQSGMSLVEATIILLVLMLLTGVLAPSIYDYVNDAMDVKVKEDCEAIGTAIARLQRDAPCISIRPNLPNGGCDVPDRADLLTSNGPPALGLMGAAAVPFAPPLGAVVLFGGVMNWDSTWPGRNVDTLEDHLTRNMTIAGFAYPYNHNSFVTPGPLFGQGWRGAYVSSPIGADPWGHKYYVNTVFLDAYGALIAVPPPCAVTDEGCYGWTFDTFCLSAGRNGFIETAFADNRPFPSAGGINRLGDDFTYAISGNTR